MGEGSYKTANDPDGAKGHRFLTGYVNVANELGLQPENDNLEALVSQDPSDVLYLHIFAFGVDVGQDPGTLDTSIHVDYYSKFREKKLLTQS